MVVVAAALGGGFGAGWMVAIRQGAMEPPFREVIKERVYINNPQPTYIIPPKDDLSHLADQPVSEETGEPMPTGWHQHDGYVPHDIRTRH